MSGSSGQHAGAVVPDGTAGPDGATSTAQRLALRYGSAGRGDAVGSSTSRRQWAVWISAGLVTLVITAVVVWLQVNRSTPVATASAAAYTVVSDTEVTVSFSVTRPDPSLAVTCTVEAMDATQAQVGVTLVTVPGAETSPTSVTATIVTLARAESARPIDNGCFAVEPPA